MASLTPKKFADKWSRIQLKEITTAQSHFNDVCALVEHAQPLQADPKGEFFTFEAPAVKTGGKKGRADVWYKNKFIWEYKRAQADLDVAYQQLLLYREFLGNPPLLITSDTQRIILHTNFTNTVKRIHTIDFDRLLNKDGLDLLQRAFHDPQSLKPDQTQEQVTQATANTFVAVAETLQKWARAEGRAYDHERLAHFIIRLLFCLFAEDMDLLPDNVFTKLVSYQERRFTDFVSGLRNLFAAMRTGGVFGLYPIPNFDGGLFDDDFVPELPGDIMHDLLQACRQDWSSIDPSIFGTLFERVIDESKRAQLGAHYTSKDDIMLIVEPVLMQPLREQWQEIHPQAKRLSKKGQADAAQALLQGFANKIAATRVLDPACGSGNFLYVALRQLLDLQKEVIAFALREGLDDIPLSVSPAQLYGIEINSYAHELAQITVWIGYLQWRQDNGFGEVDEPILRRLENIERKDAILAYDQDGCPVEPVWPTADVIIGNPPFLGDKKMRGELGHKYVEDLRTLYTDRLSSQSDLVCYWFEKAGVLLKSGRLGRAGLLATNSIRQGANRQVLDHIKNIGDIFMAWSDRPWTLDGAAVRVSMVGFDDGSEKARHLDGQSVSHINPDLTSSINVTDAVSLLENQGLCFLGMMKGGPFDIDAQTAKKMLDAPLNSNDRPNSDVIKRRLGGQDVTKRPRDIWIIDFGVDATEQEASLYEIPFEYVRKHVKPLRDKNRRERMKLKWWIHGESRPGLRAAIRNLQRCIVTPEVSKYRVFTWMDTTTVPDHKLHAFVRDDNYFFGVLHSCAHEVWSLAQGSWMGKGNDPSYSSSRTFATFPFPWPPGQEPGEAENPHVAAIAEAARELVDLRQAWLHPPAQDIGVIISEKMLQQRTLTNLYNALVHYRANVKGKQRSPHQWKTDVKDIITLDEIETLDHIHTDLDHAVLDAYGWPHNLTDEQILERLLALNLERAAAPSNQPPVTGSDEEQ